MSCYMKSSVQSINTREIYLLELITLYKSFPSQKVDPTCAFELFIFKTVIFKFTWEPCFNTNDFIKVGKHLTLFLLIFVESLPL